MIALFVIVLELPLALLGLCAVFGRQFFTELDEQCRLAFRKLERWGKRSPP